MKRALFSVLCLSTPLACLWVAVSLFDSAFAVMLAFLPLIWLWRSVRDGELSRWLER